MPRKPTKVTKVSRISRDTSLKNQHNRLLTFGKQSNNIIHVTIRSSQPTHSIKDKSFKESTSSFNKNLTDQSTTETNSWVDKKNLNTSIIDKQILMNNSKKFNHKTCSNILVDQTNSVQDHHRKKKKNKQYRCIYLSILLFVLLIIIAIAIILGILLSRKTTYSIAVLRWNSTGITIVGTANVTGSNASLLYHPYGLAFDSSNTLHIADYKNNRIQKLVTGTSSCVTIAGDANGTPGNDSARFYRPVDILFDSNDNFYVTDRANNRVQFWTKGATSGTTIAGAGSSSNSTLFGPSGIVTGSSSSTLYIAATYGHQIVNYPSNAIVAGGNGPGNNYTQLYTPIGFDYDSLSNSLLVANYGTHNIVRWTIGATNRIHVAGDINKQPGNTSTLLNGPVGLTMDPMGNMYVADSANHRIQFFFAGQSTATTIAGITGVAGTNSDQLNSPFWVLLDNQLNLYVSDTCNHRIQKFLRY